MIHHNYTLLLLLLIAAITLLQYSFVFSAFSSTLEEAHIGLQASRLFHVGHDQRQLASLLDLYQKYGQESSWGTKQKGMGPCPLQEEIGGFTRLLVV